MLVVVQKLSTNGLLVSTFVHFQLRHSTATIHILLILMIILQFKWRYKARYTLATKSTVAETGDKSATKSTVADTECRSRPC